MHICSFAGQTDARVSQNWPKSDMSSSTCNHYLKSLIAVGHHYHTYMIIEIFSNGMQNMLISRTNTLLNNLFWVFHNRAGWFGVGSQKVTAFGKLWAVTVIWPLGYMDIPWLNPLYCRLLNICVEPQIRALLT